MKKIYLYESGGEAFLACQFAGCNAEGKTRLLVTTPGKPVINLEDYCAQKRIDISKMNMLCEEGENVESWNLITMLIPFFGKGNDLGMLIVDRLDLIKRLGIAWNHEQMKMNIIITSSVDQEDGKRVFYFYVILNDTNIMNAGFYDSFKDLFHIFDMLRTFFFIIENRAGVPLKKHLITDKSIRRDAAKTISNLFDDISTQYDD